MKKYIYIFKNKDDLYFNFDKDTNMIIITGIPGSGKSYTASLLSNEYNYPLVSMDILFDYEDRELYELEKVLRSSFLNKYPNYQNFENNRRIASEVCNSFFEHTKRYIEAKNISIIFDSAYFFQCIPIDKFFKQRIIVKRTSFIKSFYSANKRDISRQYYKNISFLKKIIRTIKIPLISLFQISDNLKNYKIINYFLNELEFMLIDKRQ